LSPTAKLCADVEKSCGRTFVEAGFPELACFHNFYVASAAKWVDSTGHTIPHPVADNSQSITSAVASTDLAGVPAPPIDISTTGGSPIVVVGPAPNTNPTAGVATVAATTAGTGASTDASATSGATSGSTDFSTSGGINGTTANATGIATAEHTSTADASTDVLSGSSTSNSGVTDNAGGLSGGAIAGIVIGVLVLLAIIGVLVYLFVIKPQAAAGENYTSYDMS